MFQEKDEYLLKGYLINQSGYVKETVTFPMEEYETFIKKNNRVPRLIVCDMQGKLVTDTATSVSG
ncbi:hypothetical protein M3936_19440 [Sutcliffiella horikoshii]|uniref:hypothetical protein n=1 Tax=Sutcliffiella horikoshii TaxID=79883 RepID=UPI00203D583A|nr:hypothetical protein [Sutcliffiella horikoshii]MCM3619748.1 hypothetical protein [Sutcliffiella horikoshii]